MDYMPPKRSPEPTRKEFEKFLLFLSQDEVEGWTIYLKLQSKLVQYFEGRRLSPASDLADEVLNRVIKKVAEDEEIRDINRYVYGVARYLRLEIYRQPLMVAILQDRNDGDGSVGGVTDLAAPQIVEDIRVNCLDGCLGEQPLEKMELLLDYYSLDENSNNYIAQRKKLARDYAEANSGNLTKEQQEKRTELSPQALEKLELDTLYQAVSRIRKDVKKCAEDCYIRELKTQENPVPVRKAVALALDNKEVKK